MHSDSDDGQTGQDDEHVDFPFDPDVTDFTLIVEEKKFHVAKVVLMDASPVFRKMFTSDFKEKGVKELELPGKDVSTFELFLKCIYPRDCTLTEERVWKLLPLADEYNVKCIFQKCETWLLEKLDFKILACNEDTNYYKNYRYALESTINFLMECIYYGEKYCLESLYESALKNAIPYKFQRYMYNSRYQQLSEKSKRELLETRLRKIEKASNIITCSIKAHRGTQEIETVSISPSLFL